MFGALQGLSKQDITNEFGPEVVQAWHHSLKARPSPLSRDDPGHPRNNRRYADLPGDRIPDTESWLSTPTHRSSQPQCHLDEEGRKEENGSIFPLKVDLSQMSKILEDNKEDRDEAYKTQIAALEQQLSLSKDRYSRLEEECTERNTEIMDKNRELDSAKDRGSSLEKECAERNSEIVDKNRELDSAKAKETEQYTLIEQMQSRGEELEKETEAKFEEGRKASKTQETKKLRELVAERAKTTREYELRMKSLQEQLRHQTDRHHSEIQENRKRNDDRLQLKQELRIQEGDKAALLESEISILRKNYEETKTDYHACLKEAQQKSCEAASDFQRQDEVRQQEIDHMHDRLQSYVNETAEKNAKLSELEELLEEERKKNLEEPEKMRNALSYTHITLPTITSL